MATSGSKTVAIFSSWLHMKFSWEQTSQSVANNTTSISWKLQLTSGNGSLYRYDRPWTVTIDGTKYSGEVTVDLDANSTQTLASGTATIDHNADGSKTFAYSFSMNFNLTLNNGTYMGTYSGSGSDTLTTIARASQPSLVTYPESTANVGEFGETFSIHMNTASQDFLHVVRYSYGERTGTIATGVVNGTTWAVPLEFMNDIPNATSASGLIIVDTYHGSTKIGTKYTGFTVTVPASVKPSCSFVLDDITGVDDVCGSPVKGLSKIKITVNSTLAYSSPIASVVITANGVNYTSSPATTDYLRTAGKSTVTATVTDKRGRSGSVSYDMNVQDYSAPAISKLNVSRCDSDGTANDQGEYVNAVFSYNCTALTGGSYEAKLEYKKTSEAESAYVEAKLLEGITSVTDLTAIFPADGNSSYDVLLTVTDGFNTATWATTVSTAFTLMNWHKSGTGIRFGGVASEENTFQNDLEFCQVGNHYAFQPEAFGGTKGYILLAVITLNTLNVNAPIVFQINRRGALCPMNVYVRFASSSTTTDPELGSLTYEGDNFGAFMVKAATSTWKLYVDNITGWSNPCLQDWFTTDNQMARLSVEFPSEIVEGTDPSVLGTYYRATPAKMQSILDFVYPVGSIYLAYNHTSPATLFGGTWERIENAFLWAVDSSGTIGQTGGEATHTLTVSEMPSHQHNIAWTSSVGDVGNAEQEHPLVRYSESNIGYSGIRTLAAGGGAAHNNMPPYIQVSAWRRTA